MNKKRNEFVLKRSEKKKRQTLKYIANRQFSVDMGLFIVDVNIYIHDDVVRERKKKKNQQQHYA